MPQGEVSHFYYKGLYLEEDSGIINVVVRKRMELADFQFSLQRILLILLISAWDSDFYLVTAAFQIDH